MDKRQILILLKIGELNVANKCIKSVSVDRNFSDVGDKFSIDIVDTPDTSVSYDLELYMASGYRNITLKYGDISEDELVSYTGTVWDYTNTFVGNIKTLTITGIMNRYVSNDYGAGAYTYNINWNSYFNKREDESQWYGALVALQYNATLVKRYTATNITEVKEKWSLENWDITDIFGFGADKTIEKNVSTFLPSSILEAEYKNKINQNSKKLKITGPSGAEIELPIPDSFVSVENGDIPQDIPGWFKEPDASYDKFYSVMYDPYEEFWGKLHIQNASFYDLNATTKINDCISFYNADGFYIDGSEYNIKQDNNLNNGSVRYVTKDVIEHTMALSFPGAMVSGTGYWDDGEIRISQYGFSVASPFFIAQQYLWLFGLAEKMDKDKNREKAETIGTSDNPEYWYNGGGNKRADFYRFQNGKIRESDKKVFVLDDDNTIHYWVGKSYEGNNDAGYHGAGKIIAFRQIRANYRSPIFVALDALDYYKIEDSYTHGTTRPTNTEEGKLLHSNWDIYDKYYPGSPTAYTTAALKNRDFVFEDKDNNSRAFIINNNGVRTLFIQANPNAPQSIYGTAGIVDSGIGVDISDIVKKLCVLEGWPYDDKDITQTELVVNSDSFIMQNQTAMDFIINNLVPKAITPLGKYYVYDPETQKWDWKIVDTPQGGFYPFFDKDGKFHFQPLVKNNIGKIDIPNLGYNIPNSPMISFQINTKGTAFYVNRVIDYSPMSIVTGEKVSEVEVVSDSVAKAIGATRGHNDTFDAWLGLTYDDVEKKAGKEASAATKYETAIQLSQNALVTKPSALLMGTAAYTSTDVKARLNEARSKIEKSVIKATLSMWGNTKVAPARNITITNMVKGGVNNSQTPQYHPSSGDYLILSMQDKIDGGGYIQNLNLLRYTDEVTEGINKAKIDYSKGARYVVYADTYNVTYKDNSE